MKLFKKLRKGFTLIELVVVIAVIAILAAVSVVSYVSITNKAKQSNDQQKVDQLNLSLQAAEISGKPKTMSEALEALEDDGFLPEKFKAEAKNYEFAYAFEANRFVIVEKGQSVVYPKENKAAISADIWKFAASNDEVKADGASYYLLEACSDAISTKVDGGVDVGKNKDITSFSVESSQEKLVINAGGDQCIVTINAPSADVDYYGFAKRVDVKDVKPTSLHIYGSVAELQLEKGHAQVESTGIVLDVVQVGTVAGGTGASITNNGFIAEASLKEHKVDGVVPAAVQQEVAENMSGKEKSFVLEVGTLAQLESFRDAVNSGNSFAGLTVKLTKDIALNDGWTPIGEGSREVSGEHIEAQKLTHFFAGTFDGQNHTISNLNNKGFVPTRDRLVASKVFEYAQVSDKTKYDTYSYGLFGLVEGSTAKFYNVKFTNVDIDGSRYASAYMDSVGALLGYARNGVVIEGVSVLSGSIKGSDAISGIAGRVKIGASGIVRITKCINNANVTSTVVCSGVARVYSGSGDFTLVLTNNSNNGTVTTEHQGRQGYGDSVFIVNKSNAQTANAAGTISGNKNHESAATLKTIEDNSEIKIG